MTDWTAAQQNTDPLDQQVRGLILQEHKAFLEVLLIRVLIRATLNGSLGKYVDMQRLRTFYRYFPNVSLFLTKSRVKTSKPPRLYICLDWQDPPTSWNPNLGGPSSPSSRRLSSQSHSARVCHAP